MVKSLRRMFMPRALSCSRRSLELCLSETHTSKARIRCGFCSASFGPQSAHLGAAEIADKAGCIWFGVSNWVQEQHEFAFTKVVRLFGTQLVLCSPPPSMLVPPHTIWASLSYKPSVRKAPLCLVVQN